MPAGLTQVSRCRPHVRSRIDTGFYSEIPMHRGLVERMELAGDYSVELSLSGDVFDGFAVCEGRLVTAWLRLQSEAVPVAVLDAVLLSSGDGKRYSLADACDLVSEALQKAVQELVWTCRNDFSAVLEAGSVLFIRDAPINLSCSRGKLQFSRHLQRHWTKSDRKIMYGELFRPVLRVKREPHPYP